MMRWALFTLLFVILQVTATYGHPHILGAAERTEVDFEQMIEDLGSKRIVFIGELHDHPGHHQMQLGIIQALHQRGMKLAIGLEMFRKDSQQTLDEWVAGELSVRKFLKVYNDNWSMWPKYRKIFRYARKNNIPMVGLNIERDITRQVASHGFDSLTPDQTEELKGISCNVNPAYQDYIRRAMGGHGGDNRSFIYFCEAQLLWDNIMAKNLVDYLEQNPDTMVVVLAGSGHSWRYGIPTQVLEYETLPYRVVLPEIPGRVDRSNIKPSDTDYLWLDLGERDWYDPD